jgi:hypothetical protein
MPSRKTPIAARPEANEQRFRQALQELQQLDYFLKGTVLKRMMKCGPAAVRLPQRPGQTSWPLFRMDL